MFRRVLSLAVVLAMFSVQAVALADTGSTATDGKITVTSWLGAKGCYVRVIGSLDRPGKARASFDAGCRPTLTREALVGPHHAAPLPTTYTRTYLANQAVDDSAANTCEILQLSGQFTFDGTTVLTDTPRQIGSNSGCGLHEGSGYPYMYNIVFAPGPSAGYSGRDTWYDLFLQWYGDMNNTITQYGAGGTVFSYQYNGWIPTGGSHSAILYCDAAGMSSGQCR